MEIGDPPFPRVEVVWLDAHVETSSVTLKQAQRTKAVVTYTIGYLMSDNDDGLLLVSDCYPSSKKEGRVPNFIPHEMIERYHFIEV